MGPDAFQFFQEEAKVITPPAMLTKSRPEYAPASITTITAEQIKLTPARNIFDLMEIYVPGAIWMNQSEGPHVGIRGIISDRDTKVLLLVNGRNMNQNAQTGPTLELENWDLNDIERIDIIRGPGSVTYGPGATEGVISITTKDAATDRGLKMGTQVVSKYDSLGAHVSDGIVRKNYSLYLYGSMTRTRGFSPIAFMDNTGNVTGYMGQTPGLSAPPLTYFRDAGDLPQSKMHLQLDFCKEWKFWARYTNEGTTHNGASPQTLFPDGNYLDLRESRDQGYVLALDNKHALTDALSLNSSVSWSSQHHQRTEATLVNPDPTNVQNMLHNFVEDTLLLKTLANYAFNEKYSAALGTELMRERFGSGWGMNPADFRMGESAGTTPGFVAPSTLILNGPDSNSNGLSGTKYYVGNGWSTNTYSFLGETNLRFHRLLNVIVSGRTDKNSYSPLAFSPRVAAVSDFEQYGIAKLIWQKSVRLNTATQLYLEHAAGQSSEPETLKGLELIYDSPTLRHASVTASTYYNNIRVLGWNPALATTGPLGDLSLWGIDLEGKVATEKVTVGLNHSYTKQLDWTLIPGVPSAGVSYADYNRNVGSGVLYTGTGNNLNNWANNVTKLYSIVKVTPRLTLFNDARVFWGMAGAKDGLTMVRSAVNASTTLSDSVKKTINDDIDSTLGHGGYGADFRLDMSVSYQVLEPLSVNVFVMNLLGNNDNKRYAYEGGISAIGPQRVNWIEEPRVYGMKVDYKF